jgi:hypothetical protein
MHGLPDTGTSQTIILQRLLDKAKIKYNMCGRELIVTANSSPLGCVGNVILDIQIDRGGKRLTIDALVAENLSSNCLIAWKDMQRAGIIFPSFPAKVHLTKVAPAVINGGVNLSPPCEDLNMATKGANMARPSEPNMARKGADMARPSINPVLQPGLVKRAAVTASTSV